MTTPYRVSEDDPWQVLQGDRIIATCETPQAAQRLVAERNGPTGPVEPSAPPNFMTLEELAERIGISP